MQAKSMLLGAFMALIAVPAFAQNNAINVFGTVDKFDATSISVKNNDGGAVDMYKLAPNVLYIQQTDAKLSDIKSNDFVASAAVRKEDGKLHSTELRIFSEKMRGLGEGQRPMNDARNQTMTNATVADGVVGNEGHTLTVKYKGGEKKVVVSPDTPVVTYVPAGKSELKAGAKVIAFIKQLPDGSFEANRVSVGLNGLTPPM